MLVHEEPEDGVEAKGEPGDKGRRGDVEDGVEDGDGVGDDKGQEPEDGGGPDPDGPGADRVLGQLVRGLEGAHDGDVEELDGRVAVDKTGRQQAQENDTVSHLGGDLGGGTQGGRGRVLPGEAVDGDGDDEVDGDGEGLQGEEGGDEIAAGILHLGHEGDEAGVTSKREGHVDAGVETLLERGVAGHENLLLPARGRLLGIGDAEGDHDDEDGDEDAQRGGNSDVRDELHGPRQAKHPAGKCRDADEADGAHGVAAERVEGDGNGDGGTGADEDELDQQADGSNRLGRLASHNAAHVDDVDHMRVAKVELQKNVGSVGR